MLELRNLAVRLLSVLAALFLAACSTIPVEKREGIRNELIDRADKSLAEFRNTYPVVVDELETAEGFIIGWYEAGMLGPVRGLGGKAILYDKVNGTRTFLNVGKGGLGLGVGGNSFDQLFIFQEREPLEKFKRGRWYFDSSAWSAAGDTHRAALPSGAGNRYMINRSGAALTSEVDLIRVNVNNQLTDNGVSDWFLPNRDAVEPGGKARTLRESGHIDSPSWDNRLLIKVTTFRSHTVSALPPSILSRTSIFRVLKSASTVRRYSRTTSYLLQIRKSTPRVTSSS